MRPAPLSAARRGRARRFALHPGRERHANDRPYRRSTRRRRRHRPVECRPRQPAARAIDGEGRRVERRVWHWSQLKPPLLPIRDWLPQLRAALAAARPRRGGGGLGGARARGHGLRLARRHAAPDGPLRRPGAVARLRRPRHLPAAERRPELGRRRVLGGRRGAAGDRRQRPLHRPVGAARPPRRRASAGRRPRPRRLHRRLLRPAGAHRLRRRPRARHRRGAAVQAAAAWRAAAPPSSASSRCWCGSSGPPTCPHWPSGSRPWRSSSRCGSTRPRCRRR